MLAVKQEMASPLTDFMNRRATLFLFSPDFGLAGAREAAQIMGVLLRCDEARTSAEVERYRAHADESPSTSGVGAPRRRLWLTVCDVPEPSRAPIDQTPSRRSIRSRPASEGAIA